MENTDKKSYKDVKAEVLQRIRNQLWLPGELLPGEVDLAAEFGCARATVNRAMRELSDEGIIDRRRKTGTRVKLSPVRHATFKIPLIRAEIEATGAVYRYNLVSAEQCDVPPWLQAKLALPAHSKALHILCMHYADDNSYQFEDRWIILSTIPQAADADFSLISPNEWLVREVPFTDAEVRFSAAAADENIAGFLSLQPGDPVFLANRTTWLSQHPVTFARLYFSRGYQMVAKY